MAGIRNGTAGKIDQVDASTIHAAHDVQIVPGPNRLAPIIA